MRHKYRLSFEVSNLEIKDGKLIVDMLTNDYISPTVPILFSVTGKASGFIDSPCLTYEGELDEDAEWTYMAVRRPEYGDVVYITLNGKTEPEKDPFTYDGADFTSDWFEKVGEPDATYHWHQVQCWKEAKIG